MRMQTLSGNARSYLSQGTTLLQKNHILKLVMTLTLLDDDIWVSSLQRYYGSFRWHQCVAGNLRWWPKRCDIIHHTKRTQPSERHHRRPYETQHIDQPENIPITQRSNGTIHWIIFGRYCTAPTMRRVSQQGQQKPDQNQITRPIIYVNEVATVHFRLVD